MRFALFFLLLLAATVRADVFDGPLLLDDSDPRIDITGTCARNTLAGAIMGTTTRSCVHSFSYYGSSITLYAYAQSSATVQACVEGACETLNFAGAGFQNVTFLTGVSRTINDPPRPYAVTVTSSQFGHFDAALIQGEAVVQVDPDDFTFDIMIDLIAPPAESTQEPSPDYRFLIQSTADGPTGALDLLVSAGDLLLAALVVTLGVLVLMTLFIVRRS